MYFNFFVLNIDKFRSSLVYDIYSIILIKMENRDWMSKDRRSIEYDEGVENFINFALAHSTNHTSIK